MLIPQHMQHEKQDELEGLVSSQNYGIISTDGGMYPRMECWDGGLQAGQVRCGSGTVCWGEVWLYNLCS